MKIYTMITTIENGNWDQRQVHADAGTADELQEAKNDYRKYARRGSTIDHKVKDQ